MLTLIDDSQLTYFDRDIKQPNKAVLVMWSGGLDSTALVWSLMAKGYNVDYIYGWCTNGKVQREQELHAIENISRLMDRWFGRRPLQIDTDIQLSFDNPYTRRHQVIPWLITTLNAVDPYRHLAVEIGYTGDEIMVSKHQELKTVWRGLYDILLDSTVPKVDITYPLMELEKFKLPWILPPEIRSLIWTCKQPTDQGDACEVCEKCLKLKHALEMGDHLKHHYQGGFDNHGLWVSSEIRHARQAYLI